MSTETAETEETTDALPANLVKIPSGELHEQAEALAAEADSALESDRWDDYKAAADNERKLREEIDRRGAAAAKQTPTEAAKVPVAAQERIEQTRQQIGEGEKALAEFAGVKSRGNTPPPMGQTAEESDTAERAKAAAFMNIEKLRADLAAMEARLPFVEIADIEIAREMEDTGISMESTRLDVKRFIEEGRRRAAAKAERELAEATERHYSLMREDGVRKSELKKEALLDGMAERKALLHRQTALKDWTTRKDELEALLHRELREGESQHYDMSLLREATESVDWLTKAIDDRLPLTKFEIATRRAELEATAPPVRGSFK